MDNRAFHRFFRKQFTLYIFRDYKKSILSYHRNTPDFISGGRGLTGLVNIGKAILFEDGVKIDPNDSILTCDSEWTKIYHNLISSTSNNVNIKNIIEETLKSSISDLKDPENVDSKNFVNTFVCNVFTKIFFGRVFNGFGVASSQLNSYIYKLAIGDTTSKLDPAQKTFYRDIVEQICQLDFVKDKYKDMSPIQLKLFIFVMLFAGQETTSAFIEYALYQLAKYELSTSEDEFIRECFEEFKPARGVARTIEKDMIVEFKTGNNVDFTLGLNKGDVISVLLDDSTIFSYGKNSCPGKTLATNEISTFFHYINQNYHVELVDREATLQIANGITSFIGNSYGVRLLERC